MQDESAELKGLLSLVKSSGAEKGLALSTSLVRTGQRKRRATAATLHGGGLLVSVVDDVGYRPLPESNPDLRKLIGGIVACKDEDLQKAKMEKVDEIITYIQFANDECDYGMGLELGIDLWASGGTVFHSRVQQLLSVAYLLLDRPKHAAILAAHLAHRHSKLSDITRDAFRS